MMDVRTVVLTLMACTSVAGCSRSPSVPILPPTDEKPLLITKAEQLDAAVGKFVTIQGEVDNSKIPTILGVDVQSDSPDLRGQMATATGILRKWTVTKEQLDKEIAEKGIFANRGTGTFYRLAQVGSAYDAQVQPLR
jgi:hypothetical protein